MRMYKAAAVALVLQTTLLGAAYAQALNGNPLSDVRVRQAIEYAIDKKAIVENVFGGYAVPADGLTSFTLGSREFYWLDLAAP